MTTPSLADRCREILELERKATPGPWARQDVGGYHTIVEASGSNDYGARRLDDEDVCGSARENVDLACAARNLIRELAQHYLDSVTSKMDGP